MKPKLIESRVEQAVKQIADNQGQIKESVMKYDAMSSDTLRALLKDKNNGEKTDQVYRVVELLLTTRRDPFVFTDDFVSTVFRDDGVCLVCQRKLGVTNRVMRIGVPLCSRCYSRGAFNKCFVCSKANSTNVRLTNIFKVASCKDHYWKTSILGLLFMAFVVIGFGIAYLSEPSKDFKTWGIIGFVGFVDIGVAILKNFKRFSSNQIREKPLP